MKKFLSFFLVVTLLVTGLALPAYAALRTGSKGTDVKWHQKTMNFLGYDCGTVDGFYGSKTAAATESFQKDYGLTQDGIAGTKTLRKEQEIVCKVQELLNVLGYGSLSADGLPGDKTVKAVKAFQKAYGLTQTGVCDSTTLQKLLDAGTAYIADKEAQIEDFEEMCLESWTLPLKDEFKPITGSRAFASSRSSGTRAHAGIDFVAPAGTEVYAMTSGKVLGVYTFYESTKAVEVQNEDGSVLRYCEISPDVKVGDEIEQGDLIGTIMRADGGTEMLHLELYCGDADGQLTQRSNKTYTYVNSPKNYQRRSDLMDPTFLKDLERPE